jgi:hypothetical protein
MARARYFEDVLQTCGGDITDRGLRAAGVGSKAAQRLVTRLRELGVVEFAGPYKRRTLVRSLDDVVEMVRGETLTTRSVHQVRHKRHNIPVVDVMRLVHDPGGLFAPGATFPADQVLPRTWAPDEPDQWYIGTLFERRKLGLRAVYVYDGERVTKVDGRQGGDG